MYLLLSLLGYLAILGGGLFLLSFTVPEEEIRRDPRRKREERGVIFFYLETPRGMHHHD
ncbi:MAG: hypothetical protein AAF823_15730 [Planctomycetota bacterium]